MNGSRVGAVVLRMYYLYSRQPAARFPHFHLCGDRHPGCGAFITRYLNSALRTPASISCRRTARRRLAVGFSHPRDAASHDDDVRGRLDAKFPQVICSPRRLTHRPNVWRGSRHACDHHGPCRALTVMLVLSHAGIAFGLSFVAYGAALATVPLLGAVFLSRASRSASPPLRLGAAGFGPASGVAHPGRRRR